MPRRACSEPRPALRLFAVAALAGLVACGEPRSGAGGADPFAGAIALSDLFTGEFALVDQTGAPRADEDFAGRVQFLYFGFATCPDVCPLALGRMNAALDALDPAERAGVAAIFVTVDPERDTPEALRDYLSFNPDIVGLTGDPAAAEAARTAYKVYAEKRPLDDSALGYTMDHTSLFYLTDRAGTPRYALPDTMAPEEIAAVLRAALAWPEGEGAS